MKVSVTQQKDQSVQQQLKKSESPTSVVVITINCQVQCSLNFTFTVSSTNFYSAHFCTSLQISTDQINHISALILTNYVLSASMIKTKVV